MSREKEAGNRFLRREPREHTLFLLEVGFLLES
jgi:hypothetical protein